MTIPTEALRMAREALTGAQNLLSFAGSPTDWMQPSIAAIDAALAQEPQIGTPPTYPDYAESEAALRANEPMDERAAFEAWFYHDSPCRIEEKSVAWTAWQAAKEST